MDLASPLQPTITASLPVFVPLPLSRPSSPLATSSPSLSSSLSALSSPALPVFTREPDAEMDTAELVRVRGALRDAERRLGDQDAELRALRRGLMLEQSTSTYVSETQSES